MNPPVCPSDSRLFPLHVHFPVAFPCFLLQTDQRAKPIHATKNEVARKKWMMTWKCVRLECPIHLVRPIKHLNLDKDKWVCVTFARLVFQLRPCSHDHRRMCSRANLLEHAGQLVWSQHPIDWPTDWLLSITTIGFNWWQLSHIRQIDHALLQHWTNWELALNNRSLPCADQCQSVRGHHVSRTRTNAPNNRTRKTLTTQTPSSRPYWYWTDRNRLLLILVSSL